MSRLKPSIIWTLVLSLVLAPNISALNASDVSVAGSLTGSQGKVRSRTCAFQCAPYNTYAELLGGYAKNLTNFAGSMGAQVDNLISQMGPSPSPSPSACSQANFKISYAQVGPLCESVRLADRAVDIATKITAMYSNAAAVCWTAFALCAVPFVTITAQIACIGANAYASIQDMQEWQKFKKEAKSSVSDTQKLVTVASAAAGYTMGASQATNIALAVGQSLDAAADAAEAGRKLGKVGEEGDLCRSAFMTASMLSAVAVIKSNNMVKYQKTAKKACDAVNQNIQQAAQTSGIDTSLCTPATTGTTSSPTLPDARATTARGPRGKKTKGSGSLDDIEPLSESLDLDDPMLSMAATADGLDGLLSKLNKKGIAKSSNTLGIKTNQLEDNIAAGMSPSEALASMSGNSMFNAVKGEIAGKIKALEELAKRTSLFEDGGMGAYSKGGPGKIIRRIPSRQVVQFGKAAVDPRQPTIQELAFGNKVPVKTPGIPTGADIWHTEWHGDIFKIISQKIELNMGRVDQIEYETDLNRRLAGSNLMIKIPEHRTDYTLPPVKKPDADLPGASIPDPIQPSSP